MATVIALDDYRSHSNDGRHRLKSVLHPPPITNDSEIFGRDYSQIDNVVFAILKVREILRYHIFSNEEWQYLILCVLDAAYHFDARKSELLREATSLLKDYILEEMDSRNGKDMMSALLLLDLVEKSPARKRSAPED